MWVEWCESLRLNVLVCLFAFGFVFFKVAGELLFTFPL